MHHFHKMPSTRHFSPAQALLQRLFPEAAEYKLPDRDVIDIDADWVPIAEVVELESKIIIKAELPGVEKENLNVKIKNNILWILGERFDEDSEKLIDYLCCERNYGKFARYIPLPESANTDIVHSELRNGLLTIVFEKKKSAQPRDIDIQLG